MSAATAAAPGADRRDRGLSPASLLTASRLGIVALLLALAAAAWAVTGLRMAGMDGGPWTDPGALGFYVTVWVVMMAAMMFPSIAPMVIMHVRVQRGRRERGRSTTGTTPLFVSGYLVVWTAAGVVGYVLLAVGRSTGVLDWGGAGRWLAAGVLAAAAVYQLTPAKDACLTRCRGPFAFLLESWRDGRVGALRMGAAHGAWCVGCCWALMAALFALGVMSIAWMVVVGALIAVEKMLPWRVLATYSVAIVLAALAVGVAASPARVPGLTMPSPGPGGAMTGGMHMGR